MLDLLSEETVSFHKSEIVWDLNKYKDPRAIEPLAQLVRTADEPNVRRHAVHALGIIGTHDAVVALIDLFDSDFSTLEPFIALVPYTKTIVENPTSYFHARIADELRTATSEEIGDDADAWREWLKKKDSRRSFR